MLRLLGVSVLLTFLSSGAMAQEGDVRRITLTKAKPVRDGKVWKLQVAGECPNVPSGIKVRFELTWRSNVVGTYHVITSGPKFADEFELKKASRVIGDKIFIRTSVHPKEQKKSALKKLEATPAFFPPKQHPWTDHHIEQAFVLGDASEVAALKKEMQDFFKGHIEALFAIDLKVSDASNRAKEAEEFVKDGQLDRAAWRSFFDSELVEPVKATQKDLEKLFTDLKFAAHRSSVADLLEIANCVARRALKKQEGVYEKYGEKLKRDERKPEGLVTDTRSRRVPRLSYLESQRERIHQALGIVMEKKPEPGTPGDPGAKKPGAKKGRDGKGRSAREGDSR